MKNNQILIDYFENVLGVDKVLVETQSTAEDFVKVLVFCNLLDSTQKEMLEKMMAAIGLATPQFLVVASSQSDSEQVFSIIKNGALQLYLEDDPVSRPGVFVTYSPKMMVRQPGLKSQAWKVLQELQKQIR